MAAYFDKKVAIILFVLFLVALSTILLFAISNHSIDVEMVNTTFRYCVPTGSLCTGA